MLAILLRLAARKSLEAHERERGEENRGKWRDYGTAGRRLMSAKTSVRNGLGLSLIDDYRMIVWRIPRIRYLSNPECTVLYSEVLVSTFIHASRWPGLRCLPYAMTQNAERSLHVRNR